MPWILGTVGAWLISRVVSSGTVGAWLISRVVSSGSPWTWGAAAQAAIQKVLKLRYTLMPTLIAAGRRATGLGNIDVYIIRIECFKRVHFLKIK